jgi:DNA-binding CsgD family transcriptional regulator
MFGFSSACCDVWRRAELNRLRGDAMAMTRDANLTPSARAAGLGLETAWTMAVLGERHADRGPANRAGAPRDAANLRQAIIDARAALREAAITAAVAAHHALATAAALDEALAAVEDPDGNSAPARRALAPSTAVAEALSPREREVLALVAEGRTNKAIAEALYVSPNTIKTHVASLLQKLDAGTRVELAAIAARADAH